MSKAVSTGVIDIGGLALQDVVLADGRGGKIAPQHNVGGDG